MNFKQTINNILLLIQHKQKAQKLTKKVNIYASKMNLTLKCDISDIKAKIK